MNMVTVAQFLCILMMPCVHYATANFTNQTANALIRIECCEMLETLTLYTVERSGDRVDKNRCHHDVCLQLQIIQLFVNHTQTMLHGSEAIRLTQSAIEISSLSLLEDTRKLQTMLVLALLGRASIPETMKKEYNTLEYNTQLDVLSVRNSTCTTDKTIYSTIIIASIALLLFFIANNIIHLEQQQSEQQKEKNTNTVFKPSIKIDQDFTTSMRFLRMNINA